MAPAFTVLSPGHLFSATQQLISEFQSSAWYMFTIIVSTSFRRLPNHFNFAVLLFHIVSRNTSYSTSSLARFQNISVYSLIKLQKNYIATQSLKFTNITHISYMIYHISCFTQQHAPKLQHCLFYSCSMFALIGCALLHGYVKVY
jgi:hypothetical protein